MNPQPPSPESSNAQKQYTRSENRLQSRKFAIVAVTGVFVAALGLYGALDWKFIVEQWRYIVLGYLGVQGVTDLMGRYTGRW